MWATVEDERDGMKVYRVVTRESTGRDEEGQDDQHQMGPQTKERKEHPIAKARLVAREFNTGDKRGELFAWTPGLTAIRTVISRATTKCENGARRSIMLADVKTAFLYGDGMRSLYVDLPPEDPLGAPGPRTSQSVARYLHGHPDCTQWYPVQEETNTVCFVHRW